MLEIFQMWNADEKSQHNISQTLFNMYISSLKMDSSKN
jgi:hypothetical protein